MRLIQRDPILAPPVLKDPRITATIKNIRADIHDGHQVRETLYGLRSTIRRTTRPRLEKQFLHKCAYCETSVAEHNGTVDWFRPIFGAAREDRQIDPYHYSWLIGQWDNIYLACKACDNNKSNKFPVNFQAKYGTSIGQLRRNREAKLLDPCHDRPEKHFLIDVDGKLLAISAQAAITISILRLNRDELPEFRKELLAEFLIVWNSLTASERTEPELSAGLDMLMHLLDDSTPYVGTLHLCLWQVSSAASRKVLGQMIEKGKTASAVRTLLAEIGTISASDIHKGVVGRQNNSPVGIMAQDSFHPVRQVQIRNFKGIEDLTIEFPPSSAPILAIVGENAAGKTSVLQAIALGLAGYQQANKLIGNAVSVLDRNVKGGDIVVRFWDTDNFNQVSFSRNSSKFRGHTQEHPRVFGYGPYRLLAKSELGRSKRNAQTRLRSLFDDTTLLNGHHGWLHTLTPGQKSDLAEALQILLASDDSKVAVDIDTLRITTNGRQHPVDSLSSGMQSITSLCTDLMEALYDSSESALEDKYVILIDELDAHLHPTWRIGIVDRLKKALPNAQIIFSTHDPLSLRGLDADQVNILYRDEHGILKRRTSTYADSQSIDQVLTSNAFGMLSTHPPEWELEFARYTRLLQQEDDGNVSDGEASELRELEIRLNKYRLLGETRRERLMLAVIEHLLITENHEADVWDDAIIKQLAQQVQATLAADAGR